MNSVNTNLTRVLSPKYANKWVALNPQQTKVIASSKLPKEVLKIANEKGIRNPVITFVLKDYLSLVS